MRRLWLVLVIGALACAGGGQAAAPSSAPPRAQASPATVASALERLMARTTCPASDDADLRALAAPPDDAPEVRTPTLASSQPILELVGQWKPALQAMQAHNCTAGTLAVGLATTRWLRAAVIVGNHLLDTEWKTDPKRAARESGLRKMESGFAGAMLGLFAMSYEITGEPALHEEIWRWAADRATYAPIQAGALQVMTTALGQQIIPRAQGTPGATRLRQIAATIAAVERDKPAPAWTAQQIATGALQDDGWYRAESPSRRFSVAWPTQAATLELHDPESPRGEVISATTGALRMTAMCVDKPAEPMADFVKKFPGASEVTPAPLDRFDGVRFLAEGKAAVRVVAATPRTCMLIVELTDATVALDRALIDRFFSSLRIAGQ